MLRNITILVATAAVSTMLGFSSFAEAATVIPPTAQQPPVQLQGKIGIPSRALKGIRLKGTGRSDARRAKPKRPQKPALRSLPLIIDHSQPAYRYYMGYHFHDGFTVGRYQGNDPSYWHSYVEWAYYWGARYVGSWMFTSFWQWVPA